MDKRFVYNVKKINRRQVKVTSRLDNYRQKVDLGH